MTEVYLDRVTTARVVNGVVVMTAATETGKDGSVEENAVIRIPLAMFQQFVQGMRMSLLSFMSQGYFGDEGEAAANKIKRLEAEAEEAEKGEAR